MTLTSKILFFTINVTVKKSFKLDFTLCTLNAFKAFTAFVSAGCFFLHSRTKNSIRLDLQLSELAGSFTLGCSITLLRALSPHRFCGILNRLIELHSGEGEMPVNLTWRHKGEKSRHARDSSLRADKTKTNVTCERKVELWMLTLSFDLVNRGRVRIMGLSTSGSGGYEWWLLKEALLLLMFLFNVKDLYLRNVRDLNWGLLARQQPIVWWCSNQTMDLIIYIIDIKHKAVPITNTCRSFTPVKTIECFIKSD